MDHALAAANLHKRFKDAPDAALRDVTLAVPRGQLTALVGPDGAGKTTFLRVAAGLLAPTRGTMHVLGIDAAAAPQRIQDRISYMPQRFGLYEDLSVQENLDLYADLHGVAQLERRERFARLLKMTDLHRFTTRLAGQLSGGMKQKLGLACTLVRSPELLLLDEPTVGVDPLSRRELWQIVQELVEHDALTVVVSTAYLDEAERCAAVHVLHEGRLLASGPPAQLREQAAGSTFIVTPADGDSARDLQARLLDAQDAIVDAVPQSDRVRVIRRHNTKGSTFTNLLAGAAQEPVPPRLEDGFMLMLRAERSGAVAAAGDAAVAPKGNGDKETVIEVHDLVRRFGDFTAVDKTSFDVKRGEIFGLLGPNGAGKTTTFRMLCGLLPASGGTLQVAGVDLRRARAKARRNIGYVAQKFALYGTLTVGENLRFFGGAYGLHGKRLHERTQRVLDEFQLREHVDAPSGQLPGGFRQRLAMAVALLHEPGILFLDEPTSGADPLARREFWRRITALSHAGVTTVVTTHFMEEAEYCDRIAIQDAGRLLALGTPRAVREQAGGAATMEEAFIGIVERHRNGAAR
ncbi:ABC-2 type transport system ATP-binding protein [Pseudoduganella flava]|uniref:ABC-2 type transport system ATP-binding protein n=1 Tax=Pseudoduganella flava TaxID=871742 RepID=A0A562Q4U4_9BURK|nr:ATP-binding cassette domain-containing protein [Pseudoduganella flava]QGZ41253.1 ATP-binding cassette domain-containing protein [Pseudoduganella flava]TWI51190.1 ABC-2 type transport system ATP-binding protein [Pseudoduganella flava]